MDRALAVAKWRMSHDGTWRTISNSKISVEVIQKPAYWFPAEASPIRSMSSLLPPVEIVTKFKRQQIIHFPRTPQKAELFWVFCERNWRHQRILLWLRCLDKRNKLPDRIHSTSYLSDRSDHFKKQDLVKEKISAYLHKSGWRIKVVPILLGNPHSSGLCQIAITYNGHHCH